jgi:hypothetical protein
MMIKPETMFEQLSKSHLGRELAEYIESLLDDLCDIRTMSECSNAQRDARIELVDLMHEKLISYLKLTNNTSPKNPNNFR